MKIVASPGGSLASSEEPALNTSPWSGETFARSPEVARPLATQDTVELAGGGLGFDLFRSPLETRGPLGGLPPRGPGMDPVIVTGPIPGAAFADAVALNALENNPSFQALPAETQRRMREAAALAPRALSQTFQDLAVSSVFRGLSPAVQATIVEQLAKHPADGAARKILVDLASNPAFGRLNEGEQHRLMRLVGGTNPFVSTPNRAALDALLSSSRFLGAGLFGDAAGARAQLLRDFLTRQPATSYLAAPNAEPIAPSRFNVSPASDAGLGNFHSAQLTLSNLSAGRVTPADSHIVTIDGQQIKVTLPRNPPPGTHTVYDVAKALSALRPEVRARIKEVVIEPFENPDDAKWRRDYPGFTRSYMTAGKEGVVRLYPSESAPPQHVLEQTLIHESGHIISQQHWAGMGNRPPEFPVPLGLLGAIREKQWKDAMGADGIVPSGYGRNSHGEDFAETLIIYLSVKGTPLEDEMRDLMPERFRLLDELMA